MRLGVVSDTHNNVKNVRRIVDLFNAAQVDAVIHTGDITKASTLRLFTELRAPLYGVFGNNDVERDELMTTIAANQFDFSDGVKWLDFASRRIVVVHDPREFETIDLPYDVALHGHTHRYRADNPSSQQLVFNPGECAGHMSGLNAVGVVDLTDLSHELLKF